MNPSDGLAQPWAPRWLRRVSVALAVAFLSLLWLDAVGAGTSRALPLSLRPFVQVAQLFPNAAENVIEWRILGFRCATGKFEELDVRPFFPIHADDKESRFERALLATRAANVRNVSSGQSEENGRCTSARYRPWRWSSPYISTVRPA